MDNVLRKIKKEIYHLIPKSLGWSMKVIEKTGSGKTTSVSAFLEFLVDYIEGVKNNYYLQHLIKWVGIE